MGTKSAALSLFMLLIGVLVYARVRQHATTPTEAEKHAKLRQRYHDDVAYMEEEMERRNHVKTE